MSEVFELDVAIAGAGVVGLAIGRALAQAGRQVVVLERHAGYGHETSSRNSEVIHAGIYYPPGSLKASLCVEGKRLLYLYCAERDIPHRRCGKLIVASGAREEESLQPLAERAERNGVDDLRLLGAREVSRLEPQVRCDLALLSPSSGIVDSHALMTALAADIESAGGSIVGNSEIVAAEPAAGGFRLRLAGDDASYRCRAFVNAAGLGASALARRIAGLDPASIPETRFARGCYFALQGAGQPFARLVYPLPDSASLGVHATLDLAGRVRFGPDVEWIGDGGDYRVDPCRALSFYRAIRRYWPGLPDDSLVPDYAGIRPKLAGPGEPPADFRIDGASIHGLSGLVCLYGIESPGLTAALAIGRRVAQTIGQERGG